MLLLSLNNADTRPMKINPYYHVFIPDTNPRTAVQNLPPALLVENLATIVQLYRWAVNRKSTPVEAQAHPEVRYWQHEYIFLVSYGLLHIQRLQALPVPVRKPLIQAQGLTREDLSLLPRAYKTLDAVTPMKQRPAHQRIPPYVRCGPRAMADALCQSEQLPFLPVPINGDHDDA